MRWGKPWEERRKNWISPHGSAWHDWFAWHPVCTKQPDDQWVWLETVERKYVDGFTFHLPIYRVKEIEVHKHEDV